MLWGGSLLVSLCQYLFEGPLGTMLHSPTFLPCYRIVLTGTRFGEFVPLGVHTAGWLFPNRRFFRVSNAEGNWPLPSPPMWSVATSETYCASIPLATPLVLPLFFSPSGGFPLLNIHLFLHSGCLVKLSRGLFFLLGCLGWYSSPFFSSRSAVIPLFGPQGGIFLFLFLRYLGQGLLWRGGGGYDFLSFGCF